MTDEFPYERDLPPAAEPAVSIVRTLVDAGYIALLAGGCVRDLLLGQAPQDYDVATDAPPDRVCALFRVTRRVGAQFGVVLVKKRRRWVEVATFRTDGAYLDGRRPSEITLTDARHDALRRDFTVNGMFLDPIGRRVLDYVGGRADLEARVIRAIGVPEARFAEDYLRLLRAVRFAARLQFPIEPRTLDGIRAHTDKLARVAPERVREELERMWSHPTRGTAWRLLRETGLRDYLWPGAAWAPAQCARIETFLARLPADASFELVMAVLLNDRAAREIESAARDLTLSNEQREAVRWLVEHQADLDDPRSPGLAALKRLMVHPAFGALTAWARARHADHPDAKARSVALAARVAAIAPEQVQPPALVTGTDLLQRGLAPGPIFKDVLDELYTLQLDEQLPDRDAALRAMESALKSRGVRF